MPRTGKRNPSRVAKDGATSKNPPTTNASKAKRLTLHLRQKANSKSKSTGKSVVSEEKSKLVWFLKMCKVDTTHPSRFVFAEPSIFGQLLAAITDHEEQHPPANDAVLATHALPHTLRHQYLIDAVTQDFLNALYNVPEKKWHSLLEPVPHHLNGRRKMAPKLLVKLGGEKIPEKVQIVNKALVDWMAVMRKKAKNLSGCPWYQPSTQNQRLRTLLGSTSKSYGWRYDMSDFSFKGGLKGFLDKLYAKRYKEFGEVK